MSKFVKVVEALAMLFFSLAILLIAISILSIVS